MNQKNAIILSVIINSGLLLLLLFIGLISPEKQEPVLIDNLVKNEMINPTLFDEVPVLEKKAEFLQKKAPVLEKPLQHKLPEVTFTKPVEKQVTQITIKKGDRLENLAKQYNVPVAKIMQDNQLVSSFLRIGQTLTIIPSDEIEAPKVEAPKKALKIPPVVEEKYYVVKYGDNPWTIAMKHSIRVNDLLNLNGLDEKKAKKIKPGDKLRIR